MRPRRTVDSNRVFTLAGGNEDNDLWATSCVDADGLPIIASVWEPTPEEREQIAAGHNIVLYVWGPAQPPVNIEVTDVKLGKAP